MLIIIIIFNICVEAVKNPTFNQILMSRNFSMALFMSRKNALNIAIAVIAINFTVIVWHFCNFGFSFEMCRYKGKHFETSNSETLSDK